MTTLIDTTFVSGTTITSDWLNGVNDRLKQTISVKDFGAIGDGVTDDSAAITAALAATSYGIEFPVGEYACTGITLTKNIYMVPGAKLKFNGATGATCVTVSASNLRGNIVIDGDGKAPLCLVNVSGSNNNLNLDLFNIVSILGSGSNSGAIVYGDSNTITAYVSSFSNTGNVNDSMPQAVTLGGTANNNMFPKIVCNQIQSGLITYSSGENFVNDIVVTGAVDNGLYNILGKINIGAMLYDGSDEPAVFSGSANIGTLTITKANNSAVVLSNAGIVDIGILFIEVDGIESIAKCRADNTSSNTLRIGSILGNITPDALFGLNTGIVKTLELENINLVYNYNAAITAPITSWARFDSVSEFNIGNVNIKIIDKDNVLTVSNIFYAVFPTTNLTNMSRINSFNVSIYNADGVTDSAALFRGQGLAQSLIQINNGYFQVNVGPYLRKTSSTIAEFGIRSDAAPTIGTWRRGQVIWNSAPSAAGVPGWVCTTAGATFKAMAVLAA